jgi:hypothetical protein
MKKLCFNRHSFEDMQDLKQRAHGIGDIHRSAKPVTPFQRLELASRKPETQEDFLRLADALEAARDCTRDFLDGRGEDRPEKEDLMHSMTVKHADKAWEKAQEAQAAGVIDERLACDIGWLMVSMQFVSAQSRLIKDFPIQDYL